MSRYAQSFPGDQEHLSEADARFVGVNAKAAPYLPPTWAAEAENLTFRDGNAETRRGMCTPASHRMTGVSAIFGAGVFSDPNGVEWILCATANAVWQLRSGSTPREIAVPEAITGRVELVQAFSSVLLFRGADLVPWQWSGQVGASFESISQADPGDGTSAIPNGSSRANTKPVLLGDRVWIPHGRTSVAASELLDVTRYDSLFSDYNLAGANDDQLTALFPFGDGALLAFNDGSIQLLSGVGGDLSNATKQVVNATLGCIAPASPAQLGADVLFLSGTGVYRVQQLIESRIETAPTAVSDAIEPILRQRITKSAMQLSAAAVLGDYYFLAVPIDRATAPNAVLPYNTVTGAWEGLHTFPDGVQVDKLLVADHFGERALWGIDYANGRVYHLYDQTGGDRVLETEHAIVSRVKTRGYVLGSNTQKKFHAAQVTVETLRPQITIEAATDGQLEEVKLLEDWTRNPARRLVHGLAAIDVTNLNDDHASARREDYRIVCPFYTGSGVQVDRLQTQAPLRFNLRERGRYLQVVITNETGRCRITSTQVEGAEAEHHTHQAP